MVQVAEKAKAAVWASPFSARCSFPERHPQFAGFLHASPGQLSDALREHDLVVVIGAPVFTFHVEGHASIFDGATTIFQITDDPDAAAITPSGTSIVATMKPALTMLLELLPDTKTRVPAGRMLPPAPKAADPIPVEFLLHSLSAAMPENAVLVEEAPSHRPADAKVHADARPGQFLHHGERRPRLRPAGLGRHGVRPPRCAHRLPDRRRLGDVFDPGAVDRGAAQAAAHCCGHQQSGYGAMRSFSQVMQVRNVPGLDLPGIDFVKLAQGHGCDAVRVSKSSELASALKRGMAHDGTSLIEVMVDSAVPLLYTKS